jgi:3-hydroxyisobutyrate dehydrogenase-like beta-hydroxyacid dehydrogenase
MSKSPIGLIGVGLLGTALAERMLAAGLPVLGDDLNPARGELLRERGGRSAASPAEVAAACDTMVLCLPDSDVVASIIDMLHDRLRGRTLVIDATTGDPDATVELARRLAVRGIAYVDATIAGSSEQVRRGEAVVIVGGADDHVDRAALVLSSWSERRFHVGTAGSGARLKLVVNLVLGLNRAVLAEGLALAQAAGIDPAMALNVLKATPAFSTVMDTKGPKMVARDYEPQARLAQHLKDVRLIRDLARRHNATTPFTDVHQVILEAAVRLGYADADNSAVIEAFGPELTRLHPASDVPASS